MIFMPRFLFICGFILFQLNYISAQQRPHYTQYILNNFIVNPALAGIENYTDIKDFEELKKARVKSGK
jgi:hypothetical protein